MAQRTSQGVMDGGSALPSGTAQLALPLAEAFGRCNPDQRAPSPAIAKEDVLYATRPKPPAQLIRATRFRPVTSPAASETSQRRGGTMTSGWIILARSKPDSDTIDVFVIPPGTRTLTVTPVPSRSFAMIALSASSAALDGPYVGEPAFNIVPRLVVTLMTRPQPSRIISG